MNILYIDANIYLGFYNSNRPEYKKLLGSVIELADKIFFTQQLAFEIDRNKLNIFRLSIDNYIKQVSLTATILPEHLDEDGSPKFTDWNKARKELEKQISDSNKELSPILNDVLNDIAISQDKVSKELSAIYATAQSPSGKDLENARLRKEIGNPPGKRADPLGDQLSWEQLLTIVPDISQLWIVSTDRDYFTEHKKTLYLNPVLYQDLVRQNPRIIIKTFNILSEALRDFNNEVKIASIPSKEELDLISETEAQDLTGLTGSTASFMYSGSFAPSKPNICPKCAMANSFLEGAYLRSQYGGLTLQYICKNCGFHADTGDSFD
ncbi:PIN-like domain-containing protein [Flavobacterium caseinilyticum]|uniref:PIN like domain-containing protein n=1 Tax=Flavobacterium caseinilyticum TaxID=2541732 RepID=A0A4R5AY88_9FLAO|nr:PIN-like domain-containing protein [Flavobacterium caseinilyticum]TDD75632.1 hypothetical protein E0F89_12145 [Flavobacterium caseinilyticum]